MNSSWKTQSIRSQSLPHSATNHLILLIISQHLNGPGQDKQHFPKLLLDISQTCICSHQVDGFNIGPCNPWFGHLSFAGTLHRMSHPGHSQAVRFAGSRIEDRRDYIRSALCDTSRLHHCGDSSSFGGDRLSRLHIFASVADGPWMPRDFSFKLQLIFFRKRLGGFVRKAGVCEVWKLFAETIGDTDCETVLNCPFQKWKARVNANIQ